MAASRKARYWIGFDLGGTKMLATVYTSRFRAIGSKRRKTKEFRGARQGVAGIGLTIEEAVAEAGIKPRQVAGIGIGCPGVLNLEAGTIVHAPNLGWRNVALARTLGARFKCPVRLVNDVDAGTYAEYKFGAGRGARCLVGVFPGTGIGGGCVYEGHLLRGQTSSCLEIGHLQVRPDGDLCGCGRRGCLETVASRLAISAQAAQAAYRGNAPYLLKKAGTDLGAIRSRALARSIANGDTAVEEIVRHAAGYLGAAISNVVNLLAPDIVVLGGGMVEAMPQIFLAEVRAAVRQQTMKPFRRSVKVLPAALRDDAGVLGAAALAADTMSL